MPCFYFLTGGLFAVFVAGIVGRELVFGYWGIALLALGAYFLGKLSQEGRPRQRPRGQDREHAATQQEQQQGATR